MKPVFRTIIFLFFAPLAFAQTVTNGNFSLSTYGWGCNPEVNYVGVYGGNSNSNNLVAEVDAEAQLCQTINGFTTGGTYRITFQAARRTSCGPTVQSLSVLIGNLNGTVTRNGGSFSLTQETFTFIATGTSQTLSFTTNLPGTCNLLVDNISIQAVSVMPVELTAFFAQAHDSKVELGWRTASETRNEFYTIERSADAKNWTAIGTVAGSGTTFQQTDYTYTDDEPLKGVAYYRLSQTDIDGTTEQLRVVSVETDLASELMTYPNPAADFMTVTGVDAEETIAIFDATGRTMPFQVTASGTGSATLDITLMPAGSYLLKTATGYVRFVKS